MQTPIAKQWMELGDTYGRTVRRIMDPKEIGAPQEDHQVNLPGPLGLSETEAPTKEHT